MDDFHRYRRWRSLEQGCDDVQLEPEFEVFNEQVHIDGRPWLGAHVKR